MLGIYVHIPFCERKCNYCAFSSFVSSEEEREKYINFLVQEIEKFAKTNKKKVDTIFIGGGTPSLLENSLLEEIFKALRSGFDITPSAEITIECNPNSLTENKLAFYKTLGINRISLGVQTLDEDGLKFIGRLHDRNSAINAVKMSTKMFENVSVDLLIGVKDMEKEEFLAEIDLLAGLGITHISTYMLQVERGTPLAKMTEREKILPDDDECIDVYNATAKRLKQHGFGQYEVSNFAKGGRECRHNQKYWTGEDYIGFGLSAHSYIDGTRWANSGIFAHYYAGKPAMKEELTKEQRITEHIMLGLRCNSGVNKQYLVTLGYDIEKCKDLAIFIERGVIKEEGDRLFLNPEYYGVNNFVIVQLLP